MPRNADRQIAGEPDDLERLLIERLNSGDVDGISALYEPGAVMALPDGSVAVGVEAIKNIWAQLLTEQTTFTLGTSRPKLESGDLALTSTLLADGELTVEVARRQPDGSWLWVIDQPNILS